MKQLTVLLLLAVMLSLTGCQTLRGTTTPGNVAVAGEEAGRPVEKSEATLEEAGRPAEKAGRLQKQQGRRILLRSARRQQSKPPALSNSQQS